MIQFFTTIKNGVISNPKVWKQYTSKANGHYTVQLIEHNKRSSQANRYFHGVMLPLVLEGLKNAGFDEVKTLEDAKMVIKALFLRRSVINHVTGDIIEIIKDTSALTKMEFSELIMSVIKWAAEYLGIQIPLPNEQIDLWSGYAEAATSQKK